MENRLLDLDYRFRPPRPSAFWHWALTPVRQWVVRRKFRVEQVELRGREHVDGLRPRGGVMFAINHPAHGDPFVVFEAMHQLRLPCCYLAAWQVFTGGFGLKGWAFQRLGAFSVDREGTDLRAFRTAVDVLCEGPRPLVIFPEGDVYHLNDRVTPLREGAATIALTAARRRAKSAAQAAAPASLHVIPCAIKYRYLSDTTPVLLDVMARLERRLYWRPDPGRPLVDRIYRYAEAILALKELEYLGAFGQGRLPQRIEGLVQHILSAIEQRRLKQTLSGTIPERVKQLRQHIMKELGPASAGGHAGDPSSAGEAPTRPRDPRQLEQIERDLDDLHLVTQLFSYPGDYLADRPSMERLTETIDKFEEDALGAALAGARAPRHATVSFGAPIDVAGQFLGERGKSRDASAALTAEIERRIQGQLDEVSRLNAPVAAGR